MEKVYSSTNHRSFDNLLLRAFTNLKFMIFLDKSLKYRREKGILYLIDDKGDIPLYQFTYSTFPDIKELKEGAIEYMNKYMNAYPHFFKTLSSEGDLEKNETLKYLYEYFALTIDTTD